MNAQSPQFQYIIIIIQENRTPDNLFGAAGLPGADVQINGTKSHGEALDKGNDFNHTHGGYLAEVKGKYPQTARNYVISGAEPYWDLAAQYGFANRMFQTNQGAVIRHITFLFQVPQLCLTILMYWFLMR